MSSFWLSDRGLQEERARVCRLIGLARIDEAILQVHRRGSPQAIVVENGRNFEGPLVRNQIRSQIDVVAIATLIIGVDDESTRGLNFSQCL